MKLESELTWGWLKKIVEGQGVTDNMVISWIDINGIRIPEVEIFKGVEGRISFKICNGKDLLTIDPKAVLCEKCKQEYFIPESEEEKTCLYCKTVKFSLNQGLEG